jgi:hypothetical protein
MVNDGSLAALVATVVTLIGGLGGKQNATNYSATT